MFLPFGLIFLTRTSLWKRTPAFLAEPSLFAAGRSFDLSAIFDGGAKKSL